MNVFTTFDVDVRAVVRIPVRFGHTLSGCLACRVLFVARCEPECWWPGKCRRRYPTGNFSFAGKFPPAFRASFLGIGNASEYDEHQASQQQSAQTARNDGHGSILYKGDDTDPRHKREIPVRASIGSHPIRTFVKFRIIRSFDLYALFSLAFKKMGGHLLNG